MPDIKLNIKINAEPKKVYEALTEQKHLALWWTPDCKAEPIEDSEARFDFNPYGDYVVVRVEKLEPNKLVEWEVTDSKMLATEDWIGTTITFELSGDNGSTNLNFIHKDWKSESKCFNKCTDGWAHFAGDSLKAYLETGKGKPHNPNPENNSK